MKKEYKVMAYKETKKGAFLLILNDGEKNSLVLAYEIQLSNALETPLGGLVVESAGDFFISGDAGLNGVAKCVWIDKV